MIAKSILCTGKVQGVYYRASTKEVARSLGLCGWVKNQRDGSVIIHAEGEEEVVDQLIDWCRQGPKYARVKSVHTESVKVEGFRSFDIIH